MFEVVGRRVEPEMVEVESFDSKGRSVGTQKTWSGNWRRLGRALGDEITTNMQDPDFKGAIAGDKAASARWDARFEAHQRAPRTAPAPKVFVDRNGNPRLLDGATEAQPNPVPRIPSR